MLHAGDWRDAITSTPGAFPRLRALTAHYEFGWSGFTAAIADAKFTHADGINQLVLTAATTGIPRSMWQMDLEATSTCHSDTLQPVSIFQKETYEEKSFTTKVDFGAEGLERLRTVTPPDKKPPKLKKFKFAKTHDLQSALLFIRSRPLQQGELVSLCVYPGSSPYLADVQVIGREKITVGGKSWDAIKCSLKLRSVDKNFKLTAHKKFKNATAWISDDQDRLLLKVDAEVFIGSIWLELKSVEFAK